MRVVECHAPAKINLALHVTGRRADGYHLIDSIVAFADIGDTLRVWLTDDNTPSPAIAASGPFADEMGPAADNLVLTAAGLLGRRTGNTENSAPRFHIEKNLPVAAGIGGGSADAAAALRALAILWDLPRGYDLAQVAKNLGADVPMCVHSVFARVTDTGSQIERLPLVSPFHAVLVNPGIPVHTGQVFNSLKKADNPPIDLETGVDIEALCGLRNDLQACATAIAPAIADTIELIGKQRGCRLARMSGSGATCFGLFDDAGKAAGAARNIGAALPDAWCADTVLGSPDIAVRQAAEEIR